MRSKILMRILMATALLIAALPVVGSAEIIYQRDYDRSQNRYDRYDRRDLRDALNRLENSSAQLESDLNVGRQRRVLGGLFWISNVDNSAISEVRDFRLAVRELRRSARGGFALNDSIDEARAVLDRGVRLDRYLRLRTGRADVDADLAEIRSNLHVIADAYGLSMPYYR